MREDEASPCSPFSLYGEMRRRRSLLLSRLISPRREKEARRARRRGIALFSLLPAWGDEAASFPSPFSPHLPARGEGSPPGEETRHRLVLPSLRMGRRGNAAPFSFLASSPHAGRRKPASEESPIGDGSRGEPGKIRYLPLLSFFFFSLFFLP
ncbi:hypothetical protein BHE74_00015205 [Ensete ventricosum]|nr:hypothetical protein BHE74_00015205 [Ensete ventricosum]